LLATGAVLVLVLTVDILQRWLNRSDLERIQGRWKVVSWVTAGRAVPHLEERYCIFKGGKMQYLEGNEDYWLDEDHQPGRFDLGTRFGIYELSGDSLRICVDMDPMLGDRPTAFESKPGSNYFLWVLQRE